MTNASLEKSDGTGAVVPATWAATDAAIDAERVRLRIFLKNITGTPGRVGTRGPFTSSRPPRANTFHTARATGLRTRRASRPNRCLENPLLRMWFVRSPWSSPQISSDRARYPHCVVLPRAQLDLLP